MSNSPESVSTFDSPAEAPATNRAAKAAHDAIDSTKSKAEEVERQLRRKAAVAGEKVEHSQEVAAEKFDRTLDDVQAFIKEKPVAAAGIAFAAGVIATSLLRR